MKCPNCGKKIDKDDRFCISCGVELSQKSEAPRPKAKKKGGKKWLVALAACVLVLAAVGIAAYVFGGSRPGTDAENVAESETASVTAADSSDSDTTSPDDLISVDDSSDDLIILTDTFTDITVTDEDSAILAAGDAAETLGLENALEELEVVDNTEAYGDTYYRLQQYYQGYPVYGRAVVLIADENGKAFSLVGNVEDIEEEVSFTAEVTQEELEESLASYAEDELGLSGDISLEEMSDEALVIYNLYDEEIHLAYELGATIDDELLGVIFDANDAEVLLTYNPVTASGITGTNSSGTVYVNASEGDDDGTYVLYDEEREIYICDHNDDTSEVTVGWRGGGRSGSKDDGDNVLGDLVTTSETDDDGNAVFPDDAVTFMNNISKILDIYESLDITGLTPIYANFNDEIDEGKNALGGTVYVDDVLVGYISMGSITGVADIDAISHESGHYIMYSHIYISSAYDTAISEGFADIYGCLIESKIENWDEPDWRIDGDNINVYRNMADPADSGNTACWDGETLNVNGYRDSTIISHSAYLMWTGNNGSGSISVDELAELWYRAMLMFPSDCNFYDVRVLVEAAANNMGLTSEQQDCVAWAFEQVGISQSNISDATVSMGTISGQVMSEPDEIGIVNIGYATIIITDEDGNIIDEVITSEEGSYEIELPVGTYILRVEAENYESKTASVTVEENKETELDIRLTPIAQAEELFENYINDVLIPEYGILESGAITEMSCDEDYKGTWLNSGIMSTTIADLDGDGEDECMVFILIRDEESEGANVALSASVYEIVDGEVTRSDIIYLDEIYDSDWFLHSWNGSLVEVDGCLYFIFEYCEWPNTRYAMEIYMSERSSVEEAYSVYAYADGELEKVRSFDRSVCGEEGSIYYEHVYEDDDVTEEPLYTSMSGSSLTVDIDTYFTFKTYIEAIERFAGVYDLSINEDIMTDIGRYLSSESIFLDSDNLTRLFAHSILAEGDESPYVYEQTATITVQYSQDDDDIYEGDESPEEKETTEEDDAETRNIFIQYINNVLIPVCGIVECEQTISLYDETWFDYSGLFGVSILDLDGDGADELLVCRCVEDSDGEYIPIMEAYEEEDGSVVFADDAALTVYDGTDYGSSLSSFYGFNNIMSSFTLSAVSMDGGCYIVCEEAPNVDELDSDTEAIWIMEYKNETFQYVYSWEPNTYEWSFQYAYAYEFEDGVNTDLTVYYNPNGEDVDMDDLEDLDIALEVYETGTEYELLREYGLIFEYEDGKKYLISGSTANDLEPEMIFYFTLVEDILSEYSADMTITQGNDLLN